MFHVEHVAEVLIFYLLKPSPVNLLLLLFCNDFYIFPAGITKGI